MRCDRRPRDTQSPWAVGSYLGRVCRGSGSRFGACGAGAGAGATALLSALRKTAPEARGRAPGPPPRLLARRVGHRRSSGQSAVSRQSVSSQSVAAAAFDHEQ